MKRIFVLFFLLTAVFAYSQRNPVVGVVPFEHTTSITASETANITNQIIAELTSWGTITVVQGEAGAEYVIRGSLSRQGSSYVLSATTTRADTKEVLNVYNEQANAVSSISLFSFCAKAVERVPFPNYLVGTWQSTINMPDGPVVCIIEFRSDRTAMVERYDTWEHRQMNALRYEGYGSGTYSYAGFANRVVNVNSQQMRVDALINVNLRLEETLPEQTAVNQSGLFIVFNGDKSSFDIVNGTLPCGRNYDGPSVYQSASIGFTRFAKIR